MALIVPTCYAEARASGQIWSYSMNVTPSQGTLNVAFSVVGTGSTSKVGCESIYVYKQEGNIWILVESHLEDDENMSKTNSYRYGNTVCCSGTSGVSYKVVVTIFAENSVGRDTRNQTFYVTGQ